MSTEGYGVRWMHRPSYYGPQDNPAPDERTRFGLCGYQRILVAAGYATPVTGRYDADMVCAVQNFQAHHDLDVDGLLGPDTARALMHFEGARAESRYGIPGPFIQGLAKAEAAHDAAAQGYQNANDYGVMQWNLSAHPTFTLQGACDPHWAMVHAATWMCAGFVRWGSWDAAIIQHHNPAWAACWAGEKPWPSDDDQQTARRYVVLVKGGA